MFQGGKYRYVENVEKYNYMIDASLISSSTFLTAIQNLEVSLCMKHQILQTIYINVTPNLLIESI